ncbi:hypothetical protein GY45DRAFT_1330121 [Cubamyces sp. BRFM 1775]|nr:hypothetical protein GY45DRAFT_1330121 [Cubamyces sp. BRFM 1775]
MPYIVVDTDHDVRLSYIDSGIPAENASGTPYLTMIAINGMAFTGNVFEPMMAVAKNAGVRFVAINRRDYPGSSALTTEDMRILSSGTDEDKDAFLSARGVEVASFIDRLIEQDRLPPPVGQHGGIALIGWSLGCAFALSALANFEILPSISRSRFATYLRGVILYEPPTVAIGCPRPLQLWTPHIDTTIPEKERGSATVLWLSAYFEHGDLSSRDPEILTYCVPSFSRAPTLFNMSEDEQKRVVSLGVGDKSDALFMFFSEAQIQATYRKACFDKDVRGKLPHVKITNIMAAQTISHGIPAFWAMQHDDEEHGGGFVNFKVLPKGNHFMQWDEPELFFEACMESL